MPTPSVSDLLVFIKNPRTQPTLVFNFNVSIAPPTFVACKKDEEELKIVELTRDVVMGVYDYSSSSPVTKVSAKMKSLSRTSAAEAAGIYWCNVSVFRASGSNLTTIATPPVNVKG